MGTKVDGHTTSDIIETNQRYVYQLRKHRKCIREGKEGARDIQSEIDRRLPT